MQNSEEGRKFTNYRLREAGLYTCCMNCDAWDKQDKVCGRYNMTPPADVLMNGCKDFVQEIPF